MRLLIIALCITLIGFLVLGAIKPTDTSNPTINSFPVTELEKGLENVTVPTPQNIKKSEKLDVSTIPVTLDDLHFADKIYSTRSKNNGFDVSEVANELTINKSNGDDVTQSPIVASELIEPSDAAVDEFSISQKSAENARMFQQVLTVLEK